MLHALEPDADIPVGGSGGVGVHVDIAPLVTTPIDGLAGTGMELPLAIIVIALVLTTAGALITFVRARARA